MIKYLFISPLIAFYVLRDGATLIIHQDLLRGLTIVILTALTGLFFCLAFSLSRTADKQQAKIEELNHLLGRN